MSDWPRSVFTPLTKEQAAKRDADDAEREHRRRCKDDETCRLMRCMCEHHERCKMHGEIEPCTGYHPMCLAHLERDPCQTCEAYIAAGL